MHSQQDRQNFSVPLGTEDILCYMLRILKQQQVFTVDEGQITNVAVHPDHRRHGYGAAIVRALLRHAKDEKLESVSLEVRASNTAAIELYKRAGFTEAGRRKGFYTKPTEDALVMVCKIK